MLDTDKRVILVGSLSISIPNERLAEVLGAFDALSIEYTLPDEQSIMLIQPLEEMPEIKSIVKTDIKSYPERNRKKGKKNRW